MEKKLSRDMFYCVFWLSLSILKVYKMQHLLGYCCKSCKCHGVVEFHRQYCVKVRKLCEALIQYTALAFLSMDSCSWWQDGRVSHTKVFSLGHGLFLIYAIHSLCKLIRYVIINSQLSFTGSKQKFWSKRAKLSCSGKLRATETTW